MEARKNIKRQKCLNREAQLVDAASGTRSVDYCPYIGFNYVGSNPAPITKQKTKTMNNFQ